jgi:hypothetical protein
VGDTGSSSYKSLLTTFLSTNQTSVSKADEFLYSVGSLSLTSSTAQEVLSEPSLSSKGMSFLRDNTAFLFGILLPLQPYAWDHLIRDITNKKAQK